MIRFGASVVKLVLPSVRDGPHMLKARNLIAALAVAMASPTFADGFRVVDDRSTFIDLVNGKSLTRMGIRLMVAPSGEIKGRAFGRDVTGAWNWNGGYFCRDLYYGQRDLGPNCQQVRVRGQTLRFISDRGTGQYADLSLK